MTARPFCYTEILEAASECGLCAVISPTLWGTMSLAPRISVKSEAVNCHVLCG